MRRSERERNKDRVQAEQREWRERNQQYIAEYGKAYRESSEGRIVRQKHYEQGREQKRTYDRNRRQTVPGVRERYNATSAKYRASKLQATPRWFEKEEVEQLYLDAKRLFETTGIRYHVDHIVPLQGDTVCGLHTLANLQLLPAEQNITKGNKF